jgi:thermitase
MRVIWYSLSSVLVLGVLLYAANRPGSPLQGQEQSKAPAAPRLNAQSETTMKQRILSQDVKVTDELCRNHCTLDLKNMAFQLKNTKSTEWKTKLTQLKLEHGHMSKLYWLSTPSQPLDESLSVGNLSVELKKLADPYLKQALASIQAGKSYQSAGFKYGDHVYFVNSMPGSSGNSLPSLIAVVNQSILKAVADHQRKNLRLEPFPKPQRFGMKSVDSRTLQDKNVTQPEDNQDTSHYKQNEIVVKFRTEPTVDQLAQIRSEIGAVSMNKVGNTYVFISKEMSAMQLIQYFNKWNVAFAEPHFLYLTNDMTSTANPVPTVTPNDALYAKYQWNLPKIETELGWSFSRGAKEVVVAVVDTGVDLTHPDLNGSLVQGYNVIDPQKAPDDDVGHGTHVSGVIAAVTNNGEGVAGMTWFNKVMPVKVLDANGTGSTYSVAQGIIWAVDHGAKVINMSLGNYAESSFLHDAIQYAFNHDVVLIAASGNDNTDTPSYPAAYPEVFAVAATDANNAKASFSNYGSHIAVAAPGESIASTYPHHQYAALSGTSMASPHVAALAALIRSVNPQLRNTEVMDVMRTTAQDLGTQGRDDDFGYGLIDVVEAVKAASTASSAANVTPNSN